VHKNKQTPKSNVQLESLINDITICVVETNFINVQNLHAEDVTMQKKTTKEKKTDENMGFKERTNKDEVR
jgi:hypothetical protein